MTLAQPKTMKNTSLQVSWKSVLVLIAAGLPIAAMAEEQKSESVDHVIHAAGYAAAGGAIDWKLRDLHSEAKNRLRLRNARTAEAIERYKVTRGDPNHWEYRQLGGTDNPRGIYTYEADLELINRGIRSEAEIAQATKGVHVIRAAAASILIPATAYEVYRAISTRNDKKPSIQGSARQDQEPGQAASEGVSAASLAR